MLLQQLFIMFGWEELERLFVRSFYCWILGLCFVLAANFNGCFPLESLLEWSILCTETLQEFDRPSKFNQIVSTTLTSDSLRRTIDQFRQVTKNQLTSWCSEAPPAGWCDQDGEDDLLYPFVQKMSASPGTQICFIGDLHGSLHSLLRNLERLERQGLLSDGLVLAPDVRLVFLGDFTDGGRYGIEVWYTIMQLKIINPSSVWLVRGNHELYSSAARFGFLNGEMRQKAGSLDPDLFRDVVQCFHLLPCALFVAVGDHWMLCSHGGVSPDYSIEHVVELTSFSNAQACQQITEGMAIDFQWSDVSQHSTDGEAVFNRIRGAGKIVDREYLRTYLDDRGLVCLWRGHQDLRYGCKIMHISLDLPPTRYLPHWKLALPHSQGVVPFPINPDIFPVVTLSSAAEGRGLHCDCYGLLTTAPRLEDWKLHIKEYPVVLDATKKRRKTSTCYGNKIESNNAACIP